LEDIVKFDPKTKQLFCCGEWTLYTLPQLKTTLQKITWPKDKIEINGKDIKTLDSSGAWALNELRKKLEKKKLNVQLNDFSEKHQKLLSLVEHEVALEKAIPRVKPPNFFYKLGKTSAESFSEFKQYLSFVGRLTFDALRVIKDPRRFRFAAVTNVIDRTGFQALPIIALLSFMVGVVIAYQMALQLRNYGANVFIVDLLGLSILREFGPLLTAIMLAGRTGAAFTAQLGTMKVNQEIDALNTMGITPGELLLLPRILGLVIALPLLTIWADIFGVLGGMLMANNMLNIGTHDFLERFQQQIPLRALIIGLGKAPVFALLIASIGCFEGIQVKGSADSVGKLTTRSVVLSIFFIIVADAIFSIIFSKLKL
jgi:phospholipid/cholesterol/gamma-HCH transport system permease protein